MISVRNNQTKQQNKFDAFSVAKMITCVAGGLILLGGIGLLIEQYFFESEKDWLNNLSAFAFSLGVAGMVISTFLFVEQAQEKRK
ncbi:hypothetical protein CCU68_26000 [Pseudomonas gingeri NCPPB 3146 = LMG 5327]|uniref:AtpZ/AtpI family protein n=1 Tax=Pseudomonas gingeri NCPPB 3146 = LMG 5327 TaxID=707248 RepID=A0ABX4XWW3_9PSED|nr:hypothetical protein CCU68_26000 [Pseudomonas gingeri NCPPB 3146 = LMG 5327]